MAELNTAVDYAVRSFTYTLGAMVMYCLLSPAFKDGVDLKHTQCQSAKVADDLRYISSNSTVWSAVPDTSTLLAHLNFDQVQKDCGGVQAPYVVACIAVILLILQSGYVKAIRNQCSTPCGHLAILQATEVNCIL